MKSEVPCERKPLETRDLFSPKSLTRQGQLNLWVDIIPSAKAKLVQKDNIALPPQEEWEMRVIIYKTRGIVPDENESMADMFVKAKLSLSDEWQSTDIHWRVQNGIGSFNWRMIFPIKLPNPPPFEGWGRLQLQVWDRDIIGNGDLLGNAIIPLADKLNDAASHYDSSQLFGKHPSSSKLAQVSQAGRGAKSKSKTGAKRASEKTKLLPKQRTEEPPSVSARLGDSLRSVVGLGPDPEGSKWVKLDRGKAENEDEDSTSQCCCNLCCCCNGGSKRRAAGAEPWGAVLIGVEVLPKSKVEKRPAGSGRSDPNSNPTLPPPVGRPDPTRMLNPFYIVSTLFGAELASEMCCCFCCVIFLVIFFYTGPVVLELIQLTISLPGDTGLYLALGSATLVLCAVCYACHKCRACLCPKKKTTQGYQGLAEDEEGPDGDVELQ